MELVQFFGSAVMALLIGGFAPLVGVALGWEPFAVFLGAAAGSIGFMFVMIYGGGPIRDRAVARFSAAEKTAPGRVRQLYERYGIVGLATVAPLLVGPTIALIAALVFGVDKAQYARWYIAATTIGFAVLTAFWALVL